MLTTGFNSTVQANEILTALRTEMPTYNIMRGNLWSLPDRTFLVLVGPAVETTPLGLDTEEARYRWMIVATREIEDNDRRADELDTISDTVMGTLMDVMRTSVSFTYQSGDGPQRLGDESIVELLQQHPRLDALVIVFYTRTEINPPC